MYLCVLWDEVCGVVTAWFLLFRYTPKLGKLREKICVEKR